MLVHRRWTMLEARSLFPQRTTWLRNSSHPNKIPLTFTAAAQNDTKSDPRVLSLWSRQEAALQASPKLAYDTGATSSKNVPQKLELESFKVSTNWYAHKANMIAVGAPWKKKLWPMWHMRSIGGKGHCHLSCPDLITTVGPLKWNAKQEDTTAFWLEIVVVAIYRNIVVIHIHTHR